MQPTLTYRRYALGSGGASSKGGAGVCPTLSATCLNRSDNLRLGPNVVDNIPPTARAALTAEPESV